MAALAAMQYGWRLAAMHMLCSLGTLALRAVLVPINTGNFLFGTSAVRSPYRRCIKPSSDPGCSGRTARA